MTHEGLTTEQRAGAMTVAQAKTVLTKHDYTPGVSNTKGLVGDARADVKAACLCLKRAGVSGFAPSSKKADK